MENSLLRSEEEDSDPALGADLAARVDHQVDAVESRVGEREVGAPVGAARFGPLERRARDQRAPAGRGRRAAARARPRRGAGPARRQTASRVASVRRLEAPPGRLAAAARARGSSSAARAARLPKTKHSLSEFEASRLAPWRPLHAHSPTASSPPGVVRPSRSAATRRSGSGRRGRPAPARARGRGRPRGRPRTRSGTARGSSPRRSSQHVRRAVGVASGRGSPRSPGRAGRARR